MRPFEPNGAWNGSWNSGITFTSASSNVFGFDTGRWVEVEPEHEPQTNVDWLRSRVNEITELVAA